jgi:membrane peptidoglycan carboxypeptidase
MMVGVVTSGTGRRAQIPGHTIAGKTGTTQDNKTAAFGGITPNYAVSVMYFDPLGKVLVGGEGGGIPATIIHDAMAPILGAQPDTPFAPSDPAVEAGSKGSGYVPPAPAPAPAPTPQTTEQPPADAPTDNGNGDGGGNPGNGGGEPANGEPGPGEGGPDNEN